MYVFSEKDLVTKTLHVYQVANFKYNLTNLAASKLQERLLDAVDPYLLWCQLWNTNESNESSS